MSEILGNAVVIAALAAVVFLAARSLWKNRGRHCGGDCSHCGQCRK